MSEEQELSFEEAYAELEQVVEALEAGGATLDETLSLYERGIELASHCEAVLEQAELRVRMVQQNEDGEMELTDFQTS